MKGNDSAENRENNRIMRAIEAGLPIDASWSVISDATMGSTLKAMFEQPPDDDLWVHPLSGVVQKGTRITRDLTPLLATDVFASQDGSWKECGVENILYRPFTGTLWIRPI